MSKKNEKKIDSSESVTKEDINQIKEVLAEIKILVKSFTKNLKGLVEIQQRLVHERLGVPVPLPPKEYGEENTNSQKAKINIVSIPDNRIRVSGNTFDFKTAIKEAGFAKWEQGTKSWSLPSECLDQLIKNFEAVNLVKDTDFLVNIEGSEEIKKENSETEDSETEEDGFGSGFGKSKKV